MSKWTDFVKKHYVEMKKTMKNVSLGDAMKKAAKAWKSQGKTATKVHRRKGSRRTVRKNRRKRKHGGEGEGEMDAGVKPEGNEINV